MVAAAADGSFFVGAGVGRSSVNGGDFGSDTGYRIDGGYRWAVGGGAQIGVEAGYADLGTFRANQSLARVEAKMHGPLVGGNIRFDVAPHWYVSGRAGYMRADVKARTAFGLSASNTVDAWYAGAGFGYDFDNRVSLGLDYDYYHVSSSGTDLNPSLVSVNAEYRF